MADIRSGTVAALVAGIAILTLKTADAATLISVDLTPYLNSDLNSYSAGWNYPRGGITTIGGVDFTLSTLASGNTGIIGGTNDAARTTTIATGIYGATDAYVIVNSAWGSWDRQVGNLTFIGSKGDTYVYSLTEGVNVRDHYDGGYVNTVSAGNLIGTIYYNGSAARLDAYSISLPSVFAGETLTGIQFVNYGLGGAGSPLLAAVTVSAVPLPAALPMFAAALFGLGGLARRRRA